MEDNKIYVKGVTGIGESLRMNLAIYDSNLPEFTTGSLFTEEKTDEITGSITPAVWTEYQIPRTETKKILTVPINYPVEHIESLIKKEVEFFRNSKEDAAEKIIYFKDKIY